jgi:diadenosine tetraphosphate (Ap4A) HIT family hydrolase
MTRCIPFCDFQDAWKKDGTVFYSQHGVNAILAMDGRVPGQILVFPDKHITSIDGLAAEGADLLLAGDGAYQELLHMYDTDIDGMIERYERLTDHPLFATHARSILEDPRLTEKPIGYNPAMNIGVEAGQTSEHLHLHVVPRRESDPRAEDGKHKGVVTAIGAYLKL